MAARVRYLKDRRNSNKLTRSPLEGFFVVACGPPKPRLALRIGVAGHRPDKLDEKAVGRVEERLPLVFAAINAAAAEILAANRDCYTDAPPIVRLVSGFAQGTDRIAVRHCPSDWRIEAILPFARDAYVSTFAHSGAPTADEGGAFASILEKAHVVTELSAAPTTANKHPRRLRKESRGQGYADAASYFLLQVDRAAVAGDGQPPRTAGTGAMARHAFEGGIPVVWIATKHDLPPRLIKGFDERGHPIAPDVDCLGGPLAASLHSIFGGPSD